MVLEALPAQPIQGCYGSEAEAGNGMSLLIESKQHQENQHFPETQQQQPTTAAATTAATTTAATAAATTTSTAAATASAQHQQQQPGQQQRWQQQRRQHGQQRKCTVDGQLELLEIEREIFVI
ncbi:regulatory protein zeste-like [Strongylocentrotus purpuratus]|uniref:Uncharacterized protein n=1 Tax=Strongylocentrotus purpuratus TaxID=7668 RepID=A0A7M7NG19_STRPU|nr:regulatory protein zeste-like [Strongylocentrotus purpuratus]XP_030836014.1 regulatory protein zeste-like [Strongylocentrotus purpuratus]XP_030836015.1 regulatory protein zeste-like [Strongylocentrotus purpuratus]XP_030836370.1 regulatory protein zeste-like [Strongylocentrotus purpuratus]XP_030836371.1 regulatory protein zeste-like [Strongylocentrotus purpuratus]